MLQRALAVSMLALAWLGACGKSGATSKPEPSPSATLRALPSTSASGVVPHLTQAKPGCRALSVTGKVTSDGASISTGSLLDGEHWVELNARATVSLRHTLTSRELNLLGPGLMLPCRHGTEQVLIAEGRLSTSSNLGVRPGAEVLIATPAGTIHYGDAAIDVQFGPRGLHLRVKEGEAWLEPQDPTAPAFKNPLRSPKEAALPASKASAADLTFACKASAEAAAEAARRVLDTSGAAPRGSLGERAATHLRRRTSARAACSMAAAATGSVADPAERQSLWASIAHSDELWQSVPRAISAQKN